MRHSLKRVTVSALAVMTAFAMCLPAYAATSDDEKISSIKLSVSGEEPEAGDDVGTPEVKLTTQEDKCSIDESSVEFYDTNDDEW